MVATRAAHLGRDCAIIPVHAGTLSQRPHLAAACWSAMEHHETHETDGREPGQSSLETPNIPGQSSPGTLDIIGNESGTARKITRAEFPGDPRDLQGRVPWRPPNTPGQSSPGTLDTIWKECGTTRKITRAELPGDPQKSPGQRSPGTLDSKRKEFGTSRTISGSGRDTRRPPTPQGSAPRDTRRPPGQRSWRP